MVLHRRRAVPTATVSLLAAIFLRPFLVVPFSTIDYLPGFPGPLPFHLQTGYIGVDDKDDVQLFYYFIESEGNPREDPLVLWLSGGPGCSSFSGLAFEIGPLRFNIVEYDGSLPKLELNPMSWTKVSSIIFLDAPVGTGFSFARSFEGYKSGDMENALQVSTFIKKWLISHPQFMGNPLYIAGNSYSGFVVPVIAKELSEAKESSLMFPIGTKSSNSGSDPFTISMEAGNQRQINLKGYLLGNPGTDNKLYTNFKFMSAHRLGLISDELYESAENNCEGDFFRVRHENIKCLNDCQAILEILENIRVTHILEPNCIDMFGMSEKSNGFERCFAEDGRFVPELPSYPPSFCRDYNSFLLTIWANDISVQQALHALEGEWRPWIRCNKSLHYDRDVQSTIDYHRYLHNKGYRALIFSGDHDLLIPYLGTLAWIKTLNLSVLKSWQPWLVDGQVAGFSTEYANDFTFTTVKGGGHTIEYTPRECFAMFQRKKIGSEEARTERQDPNETRRETPKISGGPP